MSATRRNDPLVDALVPNPGFDRTSLRADLLDRDLPAGAEVTRFAPSPTGYVHIGGILVAMISGSLAEETGGRFIVRVEDTDRSRFIPEAEEQLRNALEYFDILPDESPWHVGPRGPYRQSERGPIYDVFIRELLLEGRAYPCFCTTEELQRATAAQRAAGVPSGYWGEWATCRHLDQPSIESKLQDGRQHVIRFRAPDSPGDRVILPDRVRGELDLQTNRNDVVVRKSIGLPTYHLAHVVDDHLMRITTVVRADEWISSLPLHHQLFEALSITPPSYGHIAPIWVMEGSSKRKLSKRKDPQAAVDFYAREGYPPEAVLAYLRGLANARLQDQSPDKVLGAVLRLEECSSSGQLLDLAKLGSISREVIARLPVGEAADALMTWAAAHDATLARAGAQSRPALERALALEGSVPGALRKDLAHWSEFTTKYGFLIPDLFEPVTDPMDPRFGSLPAQDVRSVAHAFSDAYQHDLDEAAWFEQVRNAARSCGFAPSAAEYSADPTAYSGSIRDAANVVRVLMTGATRSPDLFQVTRILEENEVRRRMASLRD